MHTALRPYAPADFDTLYTIDQACYPPGIAYSKRTLRWFLRLPGADCLVAEAEGRVAGFILAEHAGPGAHLITIDVLERYRRCGIGTALLREMEEKLAARGVNQVELETATDNHTAVAFWYKHGYRTAAVLKSYYPGPVDAFAMYKHLPAASTRTERVSGK